VKCIFILLPSQNKSRLFLKILALGLYNTEDRGDLFTARYEQNCLQACIICMKFILQHVDIRIPLNSEGSARVQLSYSTATMPCFKPLKVKMNLHDIA
jgi:hypothetical protein